MKINVLNMDQLYEATNSEDLNFQIIEQLKEVFNEYPLIKDVPVETYYDENIYHFTLISLNETDVNYNFTSKTKIQ